MDPQTYAEFTWPWFVKNLPFPHNYYVPIQRHKHCVNRLKLTRGIDNASQCLTECEAKVKKLSNNLMVVKNFLDGTRGWGAHGIWPLLVKKTNNLGI